MQEPLDELHKTKLTLVAVILTVVGLALMITAKVFDTRWHWLGNLPVLEIGSTLFIAGFLSIALDYFDGKEKDARDTVRLGRAIDHKADALVRAALNGMVASVDNVAVLAADQQDRLITNGLTARLGDATFASEIYTDIRDQAIRASERWHDARVQIALSPLTMVRGSGEAAPSGPVAIPAEPTFVVTIRWEYTVVPTVATRHFACVSDKDEYRELAEDAGATSAWFMRLKEGVDPGSRQAYELVQFTVDGEDAPIRRAARKGGQTYSVTIGKEHVEAAEPVRVSYTYRALVSAASHVLHIDLEQPTRGIEVELAYGDTEITNVSVIDAIASSKAARVQRTPASVPGRSVTVEFDGWAFPRSGVSFVW